MANKKNYPRNTLSTWPWDTGFPEGIPGNFVKQQPRETTTLPTRFTPQIASDSPGAAETMPDADLTQFGRDYTDVHRTHTPAEDELASWDSTPREIDVNTKGPWGHPMC
ncbi:hypothetical protein [Paraprevotella clara]|uniref:hypothetical protein n=1 Tax=Paraprevotella clara TaxID=454154 RepID=UPI003AB10CD9